MIVTGQPIPLDNRSVIAVIMFPDGPRETWVAPGCRSIRVATLMDGGFGAVTYTWDGQERNRDGWRIYR